jgi:hypothetical protein
MLSLDNQTHFQFFKFASLTLDLIVETSPKDLIMRLKRRSQNAFPDLASDSRFSTLIHSGCKTWCIASPRWEGSRVNREYPKGPVSSSESGASNSGDRHGDSKGAESARSRCSLSSTSSFHFLWPWTAVKIRSIAETRALSAGTTGGCGQAGKVCNRATVVAARVRSVMPMSRRVRAEGYCRANAESKLKSLPCPGPL